MDWPRVAAPGVSPGCATDVMNSTGAVVLARPLKEPSATAPGLTDSVPLLVKAPLHRIVVPAGTVNTCPELIVISPNIGLAGGVEFQF